MPLIGPTPYSKFLPGRILIPLLAGLCLAAPINSNAQVPALLNYQGRVAVRATAFEGTGLFKLALVNTDGSVVYWRNAPDANNDGEPDAAVSLPVAHGFYSVSIGDTSLANMAPLPSTVFSNSAVFVRVWFNDGTTGFQKLSPDQRITAVGYAMMASDVSDGAITPRKLSPSLATQFNSFTAVSPDSQDSSLTAIGYQTFMTVPAPAWVNGSTTDGPAARAGHTAVWSGQDLIVWGGHTGLGSLLASGGAYQPSTDQWRVLSPLSAPAARSGHGAVWTGAEMIIWGGAGASGYLNSGARYEPVSQQWTALPVVGAPSGRQGHATVWTGSAMIVFGGLNATGLLADGATFNPTHGQWSTLPSVNAPSARNLSTAIWTGDTMIVWGGQSESGALNTGARLKLSDSAWQTLSSTGAPSARYGHAAVWTGRKLIVWGGTDGASYFGDGAAYDPVNDTWSPLSSVTAPSPRANHNAFWTGTEMIVIEGENTSGVLSSGAAYEPAANKWRTLTNPGQPVARSGATATWSGTEALVFGGQANGTPVAALQKLNPQPAFYLYRKL